MKENIELLNYIYQNAQMGITSIEHIIDIAKDASFIKFLKKQKYGYESISDKVIKILNKNDELEKGLSTFTKIKTYLMINAQAITDKSTSHLSEMMIIGSTMGVIDTIKNLEKYNTLDSEYINLLKELHNYEESNINLFKKYL